MAYQTLTKSQLLETFRTRRAKMKTVSEAIISLSADHYDGHIPSIRAWIEKETEA